LDIGLPVVDGPGEGRGSAPLIDGRLEAPLTTFDLPIFLVAAPLAFGPEFRVVGWDSPCFFRRDAAPYPASNTGWSATA